MKLAGPTVLRETAMADKNENIEQLKKCDAKSCSSVLHRLTDGLCHKSKPTYQEYSKTWSLQEWWAMSEAYTDFLKTAVKETWTKDQITQQLESLPEEYKTVVCDVINSRRSDIRQQLLADSHSISHSVMTDFDWKLKLVMSSDKLSSVQEPVLSLDMDVKSNSDRQTVSVELSREDLKKLITSLEAANKALIQLKS